MKVKTLAMMAGLGGSLFMQEREYSLPQATVFGIGSGIGWALAIISMAAIRQKLRTAISMRVCPSSSTRPATV